MKSKFVVKTYENGWYHFYLFNEKPLEVDNGESLYEDVSFKVDEYGLEFSGNELVKNGEVRDTAKFRHTIFGSNYVIHIS